MEKNYYDILQINQNASVEIIEKAYKTLAKKYHPDLQPEASKKETEEILKVINEAYEVLSDPIKKASYDQALKQTVISEEDYQKIYEENQILQNELKKKDLSSFNCSPSNNPNKEYLHRQQEQITYQEQLKAAQEKAYHDAYVQDLKSRGYKIRYKKSLKDYLRGIITIIVVVLVLFLLCQLPFVQNFFIKLYEKNEAIKNAVNIILNIFQ